MASFSPPSLSLYLLPPSPPSLSPLPSVKGVNYFGLKSEYVVSGSDCGHVFLWDKNSTEIVQFFEGDNEGVVILPYTTCTSSINNILHVS